MGRCLEIYLDDHNNEFVQGLIDSGEYKDISDVIGESLFYLEEEVKHRDEQLSLTPKGCLEVALTESSISDVDICVEDERCRKFNAAYLILERRMKSAGYISDEKGEPQDSANSDKPFEIFSRTIKGFYTTVIDEQLSVAWELFLYYMERHGNTSQRHE